MRFFDVYVYIRVRVRDSVSRVEVGWNRESKRNKEVRGLQVER